MNIFDRFVMTVKNYRADRWLERYVLSSKGNFRMVETWKENVPQWSNTNFAAMVKYGWRRNELIFACLNKTANTASQVNLRTYSKSGSKELPEHPARKLIEKPNPFMSEFDFWVAVILYTRLAGKAVFEKERNNRGEVVRLWPLRPDWVHPIADAREFISAYSYEVPGSAPQRLDLRDVLVFQMWDPLDQYNGWPPVAVAARVGDVDNASTEFIKLFFEKGGAPAGLLKSVQKLNDAQVADIRRRWRERYGGYEHWLEPAVLDSDAEYQRTGLTFTEMGFETLDSRNEARICMVMDVPPILVGAKIGLDRATYANYQEARSAWWQDTLMAIYANFHDVIDNGLLPEFPDHESIYMDWDFSRVPSLQEEMIARWTRALEGLKSGGVTLNEFREMAGLRVLGPRGDVFIRSLAQVEVPIKLDKPAVPQLPASGADDDEPDDEPDDVDTGKSNNGHHHHSGKELFTPSAAPDDDVRRKMESDLQKKLAKFFQSQRERLLAEVEKDHAGR